MTETVYARGEGGAIFRLDVPPPPGDGAKPSFARERWDAKIERGDLVVIPDDEIEERVVDGATVFLNRDGGSWNPPGPLSFSRFLDANRDANVGPYAANLPECAPLVTHRLKTTCNWNWSQNLTPIRSIRAPSGPRRAPAPTSLFPRSSIRSASPPT